MGLDGGPEDDKGGLTGQLVGHHAMTVMIKGQQGRNSAIRWRFWTEPPLPPVFSVAFALAGPKCNMKEFQSVSALVAKDSVACVSQIDGHVAGHVGPLTRRT